MQETAVLCPPGNEQEQATPLREDDTDKDTINELA